MNSTLRIMFMGTPDFAVESLHTLQNSEHEIVGVVTAPDKPAGRGKKMRASAVKEYCLENNLLVLQPSNLKDEQFIMAVKNLQPDVIVVVAFRMLPEVVWQLAPLGTINLHASLLPNYRGAAPINWAIVNGETKTGVTTFFINEEIDTGDLIAQREVEIGEHTTAGELHDQLMEIGALLLLETVNQIAENKVVSQPQKISGLSENLRSAPKISKEHLRIDWNRPAQEILNLIRGMSPYPAAFTLNRFDIQPVKITKATTGTGTLNPGKVRVTGKKILEVGTGTFTIEIQELQLAGKKRMDVVSFLNGYNPDVFNQLY